MSDRDLPQPMRPHGFAGRVFGVIMEWLSAGNYRWVVAQLMPAKPKCYLEIGFGTGKLAEMVAKTLRPARLVGVDPSELMLATAAKKLRRFRKTIVVDLQRGDDALLAAIQGPLDAVVATHSFQFWSDPVTTLARIHALLSPQGTLVLVLRPHISARVSSFIPNPITRAGNERDGVRQALAAAGFRIAKDETLKSGSFGLVAGKR